MAKKTPKTVAQSVNILLNIEVPLSDSRVSAVFDNWLKLFETIHLRAVPKVKGKAKKPFDFKSYLDSSVVAFFNDLDVLTKEDSDFRYYDSVVEQVAAMPLDISDVNSLLADSEKKNLVYLALSYLKLSHMATPLEVALSQYNAEEFVRDVESMFEDSNTLEDRYPPLTHELPQLAIAETIRDASAIIGPILNQEYLPKFKAYVATNAERIAQEREAKKEQEREAAETAVQQAVRLLSTNGYHVSKKVDTEASASLPSDEAKAATKAKSRKKSK